MKKKTAVAQALTAARAIIKNYMELEITSCAIGEKKPRPGSIKSFELYYHPDSIDCFAAAGEVRRCKAALRKIDAALPRADGGGK